jgi:hypothetical protein
VILDYKINEDFIAKNLCENRNKPTCCCHGKCYLGKQLANEENQQQSPDKGGQREQAQVLWFSNNSQLADLYCPVMLKSNYSLYLTGKSQEFTHSFFQPPQV